MILFDTLVCMEETTHTGKFNRSKHLSRIQKYGIVLLVGILVGALATTALRFALIKDTTIHYHANFSLYINGQKDEFKSFTFYEEVAACDDKSVDNPKVRTHMHGNEAGLVHVHAAGVTWGQFFENLGYTLGNDLVQNDNGTYLTGDDGNKLSFMLNGEAVDSIANKVIGNEDRLLINYGKDDSSTLEQRYDSVPSSAPAANKTKDPAACTGAHEFTTFYRLKQAIGISQSDH